MSSVVVAGGRHHRIRGIVFDKDGTLIDLDAAWAGRAGRWMDEMARHLPGVSSVIGELAAEIGLDGPRVVSGSVLAAGTMAELVSCIETMLSRHRVEAESGYVATLVATGAGRVVPLGDVSDTLARLTAAGLVCTVLSSDDRHQVVDDLKAIGATPYITASVCGDDDIEPKPSPAGIWALAATVGVDSGDLLVVGDSPGDRAAANAAGAAGFALVAKTEGGSEALRSIDELLLG